MKSFIEEYGLAILIIVVIVIMIAMTTPIGDMFESAMLKLFGNLENVVGGSTGVTEQETTTASIITNLKTFVA